MINNTPVSISDFVHSVKDLLEGEFRDVQVVGEVSNLSLSSAGHYYFSLSDQRSSVSCAMFKFDAMRNPFIKKLKNGQKVILRGPVSVYTVRGTFQILGKRILPYGKGDLNAQFELLKNKLMTQGYFEESIKKPIPEFPKRIAVITALRGAALQDFLNIVKRRSHWCDILIIPSIVQGNDCARSIVSAIGQAESVDGIETIVITRGGGSIEDLWGFNEEVVVQKVFDCHIPIISAVGHQTDRTLIDYVSDLRAETPSAAAEIITEPQMNITSQLKDSGRGLKSFIIELKSDIERRLNRTNPKQFQHILHNRINSYKLSLSQLNPNSNVSKLRINEYQQTLDDSLSRMRDSVIKSYGLKENRLNMASQLLTSLNPKNVLGRGYTYLESQDGLILTDKVNFDKIQKNEELKIHFKDGFGSVKKV